MGAHCPFRSAPCRGKHVVASVCVCSPNKRARQRRGPTYWLTSPVASNLVIDRPPANKPKLSYVGSTAAGTASYMPTLSALLGVSAAMLSSV